MGDRGFYSYLKLNRYFSELNTKLDNIETQSKKFENKVKLLDLNGLDLDYLDEIARKELGLLKPEEKCFVITY
jgi:cell division protein FtsB